MLEIWTLLSATPWSFAVFIGVLGLLVGSFLNVVIHRLPIMMERQWRTECAALAGDTSPTAEPFNLVVPRSRCPHCGVMIRAWDNVPLVSFALLGGRCRHCRSRIPLRYPAVEAASGVLGAWAALHFGPGWAGAFAAVLTWALVALSVIDFDTQLLPDAITLPFLWLGLLLNTAEVYTDLGSSVVGAAAGYLVLWSVYWAFKLATGKEGMGYGDFKLLGMLGAWFGWQLLPIVLLAASVVGAVVGISLIAFAGHARGKPIPFGPYLACAGWVAMMWGDRITATWLGLGQGSGAL
ncbi:MAG: A24 family peptidase [Gammaproteobacteria bacterium]